MKNNLPLTQSKLKNQYGNQHIVIRSMTDHTKDYALIATWLSNPVVCDYYEGRTKPLDLEKVKEKFAHRARGESRVTVCIIEYENQAIGFVQFYPAKPNEYGESEAIDMSKYEAPYGMDIVIGDPAFWNQGIGTEVVRLTIQYLFRAKNADIILIDPQTRNARAIRCYEKSGFHPIQIIEKREFCDDEYQDSVIMCIVRGGHIC